jgi:hypothetical protein
VSPAKKRASAKTPDKNAQPTVVLPTIDPALLGLRPKPVPAPEILAALTAAAQLVWPQPMAAPAPEPRGGESWRFSGRWWAQPALVRRARPWTGR